MYTHAEDAGVTIVGAGALGQAYAAQLARGGVSVALVARPATAARLVQAGGIRVTGCLDLQVPVGTAAGVRLVTDPGLAPPGAGVLFATKAHQLHAAIEEVRSGQPWPPAWVLGVQNGLQKDEVLAEAFGIDRVVGAATIMSAQHGSNGLIVMTNPGPTYLGELNAGAKARADHVAELLAAAGVSVQREADVRGVLWSKACNAAGVFGVCVLARCSGLRMSASPDLVRAYLMLVREAAALASTYGVAVGDYPGFPIRTYVDRPDDATIAALAEQIQRLLASDAPENYPSMVQDVLAGRPMEVEGVFGNLVERAERAAVRLPAVTFVTHVLRGIDRAAAAS